MSAALVMGQRLRPISPRPFTELRRVGHQVPRRDGRGRRVSRRGAEAGPGSGEILWDITVGGISVGVARRMKLDAPVWASPRSGSR